MFDVYNWRASVASETLTGVTQLKIRDVYWRASEASETVLWVDNAKSGMCYMYVCMYVWMVHILFKRARRELFSPKKHGFLGFTPVYSETTTLSKPYFILKLRSVRKFQRKRLLFKKQKVDYTGYYDIEDLFPDLISELRRFRGRSADCWLSRAIGSVRMLRKLLPLQGRNSIFVS